MDLIHSSSGREFNPVIAKNRVPTDAEKAYIQRLLIRECKLSETIEEEVGNLSAEIVDLEKQLIQCEGTLPAAVSTQNPNPIAMASQTRQQPQNTATHSELHMIHNAEQAKMLETDIDGIRSQIAFANESLTHSINYLNELRQIIKNKREMLSARRIVPVELWKKIFEERVLEDEEYYERSGRSGNPPFTAFSLSHTCRFWRQIALNTPSLWQYVPIPCNDGLNSNQVERIFCQSERMYPLDPVVYASPALNAMSPVSDLSSVLKQSFKQYRVLEFQQGQPILSISTILLALVGPIHELRITARSGGVATWKIPSVVLGNQVLSHVASIIFKDVRPKWGRRLWEDVDASTQSSPVSVTFHHSLYPFGLSPVLNFLGRFSHVNRLSFKLEENIDIGRIEGLPGVTLPLLTYLTAPAALLSLLSTIDTPSLTHLTIDEHRLLSTLHPSLRSDAFINSGKRRQTIQVLVLDGFPEIAPAHCINIVKCLPRLSHLTIRDGIAAVIIEALTTTMDIPPCLEVLSVVSHDIPEATLASFLSLPAVKALPGLKLYLNCNSIGFEGEKRLRMLLN